MFIKCIWNAATSGVSIISFSTNGHTAQANLTKIRTGNCNDLRHCQIDDITWSIPYFTLCCISESQDLGIHKHDFRNMSGLSDWRLWRNMYSNVANHGQQIVEFFSSWTVFNQIYIYLLVWRFIWYFAVFPYFYMSWLILFWHYIFWYPIGVYKKCIFDIRETGDVFHNVYMLN